MADQDQGRQLSSGFLGEFHEPGMAAQQQGSGEAWFRLVGTFVRCETCSLGVQGALADLGIQLWTHNQQSQGISKVNREDAAADDRPAVVYLEGWQAGSVKKWLPP